MPVLCDLCHRSPRVTVNLCKPCGEMIRRLMVIENRLGSFISPSGEKGRVRGVRAANASVAPPWHEQPPFNRQEG